MIKIFTGDGFSELVDDVIICPEYKLHPHFFENYVKDMCEKAKEEDISIFTYSPMLIEFFQVLSQYYEVESEFYLIDAEDGFLEYDKNELYDIYEYLSKGYSRINMYHIRVRRGQRASDECSCCNGGC